MNRSVYLLSAALSIAVFGTVFYFAGSRKNIYAQRPATASLVSRAVETAPAKPILPGLSKFAGAARRNSLLSKTLSWTFAGKQQKGWEIYVPLIANTVGVDAAADSPEFAAALSKWQERNGLPANGVLETTTLQALIRFWQGQRLGRSSAPTAESLLSAPISDFFDRSRDPGMLQLERETYAAYRRMIAAAAKDLGPDIKFSGAGELAEGEKFLRIISAYRSPAYQESLRRKEPNAGRGALARFSAHSTGQALDIYVGGEPVTTKDHNRLLQVQTPAYKWLVKNANRFGFYNYFYEPWHWEYVPGR